MICNDKYIRIFSTMNDDIDFIILPEDEKQIAEIGKLANVYYWKWFEDGETAETIFEYVESRVKEHGFSFEMFVLI